MGGSRRDALACRISHTSALCDVTFGTDACIACSSHALTQRVRRCKHTARAYTLACREELAFAGATPE